MDERELAISLARVDREDVVVELLEDAGCWEQTEDWRYYGDNESNYSIIGNQQRDPEAALVEKIVNSVDAVLLDEARRREIDPEGPEAPRSISAALEEYFDIYEGELANVNPFRRTELAERIGLVATGSRTNPSYSIVDTGEGQLTSRFPDTFLSLPQQSSNKLRIPFVQGKFNMGGTGSLPFCGDRNLQFILSRRNPTIAEAEGYGYEPQWGFTVVRKRYPEESVKNPVYEYLAPGDSVLSFEAASLPLAPGDAPDAYGEALEWGSFVKLYEYAIGPALRTNILFDLHNRISLLLPSIALPVRFYERRGYSGHSLETTLAGLSVRVDEDRSENLETSSSGKLRVHGNTLETRWYLFNDGDAAENYRNNEVVLFTVNGQTHAALDGRFFTRKSLGKIDYLSDSILVVVDCSGLDSEARDNLFMASRDRLRNTQFRNDLLDELEQFLAGQQGLREIANRRRREAIEERVSDSKPLEEVVESLINRSPSLAKLFSAGERLTNPFAVDVEEEEEEYEGEQFPSFFRLEQDYPEGDPKQCTINRRFRVQYATDVENDYFDRDRYGGEFSLMVDGDEVDSYSINLWKGTANLNISLPDGAEIGDTYRYRSRVTDPQQIEPFEDEWWIEVVEPATKSSGKKGKRKGGASGEEGGDKETSSRLSLPELIEVQRDDENWERWDFKDRTALVVKRGGEEGYDFYVNVDNVALKTEQKRSSKESNLLEAQFKYGVTVLGLAYLKEASDQEQQDGTADGDPQEDVRRITRALAPVVIPMVESLGGLDADQV